MLPAALDRPWARGPTRGAVRTVESRRAPQQLSMRISSTRLITAERGALRYRHAAHCCTGAGPARPHEGAASRLQALRLVRSWLGLAHPNPNPDPNPHPNPDPDPNPGTVRIGTIRSLRVTFGSRRGRRRTTSCVSRRDGDRELARYILPRCLVTHLLAHLVDPLLTTTYRTTS